MMMMMMMMMMMKMVMVMRMMTMIIMRVMMIMMHADVNDVVFLCVEGSYPHGSSVLMQVFGITL